MASLLLFFRTLSFFSFLFPSIQTLNLVGCSSWQRREISTIRFIVEFYLAGKGRPEEFDSDCHAEQKDKKKRKKKTPPITSTTNTKSLLIKKQMGKATLAVKNSAAAKASASSRLVSNIVEEPQLVAERASTTISSTNLERQ